MLRRDFIGGLFNSHEVVFSLFVNFALMSRIEHKYCATSTSYLMWLFDVFVFICDNCVSFGDFLPMRTPCDGI